MSKSKDNAHLIEDFAVGETVYRLRTRLPWKQQSKIDSVGMQFVISGRDMQALTEDGVEFEDIEQVALVTDPPRQNNERLLARLVGFTRRQIDDLPSTHVALLIARIRELEGEEKAEIAELRQENPTVNASSE